MNAGGGILYVEFDPSGGSESLLGSHSSRGILYGFSSLEITSGRIAGGPLGELDFCKAAGALGELELCKAAGCKAAGAWGSCGFPAQRGGHIASDMIDMMFQYRRMRTTANNQLEQDSSDSVVKIQTRTE